MLNAIPIPGRIAEAMAAVPGVTIEELDYAWRVLVTLITIPANVAAWCTTRCPECDATVKVQGDSAPPLPWLFDGHVMVGTLVVVGCEGYRVISPGAVGLPPGQWQDWCLSLG